MRKSFPLNLRAAKRQTQQVIFLDEALATGNCYHLPITARRKVMKLRLPVLVLSLLIVPSLFAAWSGWREVPGNGQTDVALGAVNYNGKDYLFGKGLADRKGYVATQSGGSWG